MKLNLSNSKLLLMRDGLMALESGDRIERGDGGLKITREPYALGILRLDIARNLNKIRLALEPFEDARNGLIREISGGGNVSDDHPRRAEFEEALAKMLKQEQELDLIVLPKAGLNLDKQELPIQALAAIAEIIE